MTIRDAASATNGKGQLTGVSNSTSAISLTGFDAIGNVVASKQTTGGPDVCVQLRIQPGGVAGERDVSFRPGAEYGYDGANRPASLGGTLNGVQSTYAAGVTYAPHGGFNVPPYGNGLTQHNWYDNRLRPQTLRSALNDQTNNTYLQMNLSWNANNALGALSNNNGGPGYASLLTFTQNFAYDNLNRLASATDSGGWSRSFQYDAYGNMWLSGNSGAPLAGNTPTANVFTATNQISGASYPLANVDPSGMDTIAPGDPDFPDPCGGDPFCGWWPLPFPPVFTGGGGGGGSRSGSGGSRNGASSGSPLPPNSFPGGETLGVPPSMHVPLPSPSVLLGLGLNLDCEFGVCLPGLSNGAITVSIYDGAQGFGHAGIGVNSQSTFGLYPVRKPLCLIFGCSVSGVVQADKEKYLRTVVIKTTPEQDRKAQDAINRAIQKPPTYNLYNQNCASFVESVLSAAGVKAPATIFPNKLGNGVACHR